ncbi:hypothetical protein BVC80_1835g674 [Macleaya cordata]|uniref:Membrane-associated kinase regulator 4 n=1 Tax=Macleaya cordata TaxID=56857 RepID=A0A200R675_MACCD|nr:hypothetical protein BVC80_1835g674 [Macleaya cordata]
MANRKLSSCDHADEDYIDMEVSSSSTLFCYSISSPQQPREFEFQMFSPSLEREPTISPADELFYKGKLLPLHLPPRLQMVQKLLQSSNTSHENKAETFEQNYTNTTPTPTTSTSSTPFESCNVSPSHSCPVSRELNPTEYFFECPTEVLGFIDDHPKKSWSKKLKLIKQSSLGMKLKASGAYVKSLFSKSGCSDEACFESTRKNGAEGIASKGKECLKRNIKVGKKNPFGHIHNERYKMAGIEKEKMSKDNGCRRRSSFSGVIKHCSSSSASYSSLFSSANSKEFFELHLLKRSDNSEIESAVQGAIAHCKQSPVAVLLKKD